MWFDGTGKSTKVFSKFQKKGRVYHASSNSQWNMFQACFLKHALGRVPVWENSVNKAPRKNEPEAQEKQDIYLKQFTTLPEATLKTVGT